jgi:hypothetical protein
MAMNKKELAEMESLKTKLALRLYPEVKPDIPKPTDYKIIVNGYLFNSYLKRVEKACSTSIYHGNGIWDKTISQNGIEMYSTEKLAYEAMLHELSLMFAGELRSVEKRMEEFLTTASTSTPPVVGAS